MSSQTESVSGANGQIKAASPWMDGVGFALKMEGLKKGETINIELQNTSQGGGDKSQDSVVLGPYRPNGESGFTGSIGIVNFQMWGSSTGDPTVQDISVPIYRFDFKPRNIQIILASNFTSSNAAAYFITFYAWYKKGVNDLTMTRTGGKTSSSVMAWWVDADGDYNTTSTNFNDGGGKVEYPIS